MFTPRLEDFDFNDLVFHQGGGQDKGTSWKELAGNGFVLNSSSVELEGILDGPYTKRVTVRHLVSGRVVDMKDVQANQGEFTCNLSLRRGRNTLGFRLDKGEEARGELLVDVFLKTSFREWAENIVKALILVILVKTFVVQAFFIPTGSMEDTLFPGDYILVDKVSWLFGQPERGDIVVFQYPLNFTQDFIKRLVALDGDELQMRSKEFTRNGALRDEPYVVHKDFKRYITGQFAIRDNWGPIVVPPGHVFCMGDNRDFSQDGRFWGPLARTRLKGKAFVIYFPFKRFGLIKHTDGPGAPPSSVPPSSATTPAR